LPEPKSSPGQSSFGEAYSGAYDSLYADKDYEAECDMIERLFADHSSRPIGGVLDLGCGTGGHAIPLANRGYRVLGVDRSPQMLDAARNKASGLADFPDFREGDVTTVRLNAKFDAVVMMFAVLGYQTQPVDLAATLETVREHLRDGGIFIADVWYGPAVLAQRPGDRVKEVPTDTGRLVRSASGKLDPDRSVSTVNYRVAEYDGDRLVRETSEEHVMRYFSLPELADLFEPAGLRLVHSEAFMEPDRPLDTTTWNATVLARA
jgi:SAM-dependent methyltransferase